jgi:hypothetical protein
VNPRFTGSNLAKDDGYLRVIKIEKTRLPSEGN